MAVGAQKWPRTGEVERKLGWAGLGAAAAAAHCGRDAWPAVITARAAALAARLPRHHSGSQRSERGGRLQLGRQLLAQPLVALAQHAQPHAADLLRSGLVARGRVGRFRLGRFKLEVAAAADMQEQRQRQQQQLCAWQVGRHGRAAQDSKRMQGRGLHNSNARAAQRRRVCATCLRAPRVQQDVGHALDEAVLQGAKCKERFEQVQHVGPGGLCMVHGAARTSNWKLASSAEQQPHLQATAHLAGGVPAAVALPGLLEVVFLGDHRCMARGATSLQQ